MIIFDLDGTLADCEHRRYLINPEKYPEICEYSNYRIIEGILVDISKGLRNDYRLHL